MKRKITIIGGGLSGLALANGLRLTEVPVEVLEAGHYPRHRVCGEFIAGLSQSTIATLGLESCFEDAILHHTSKWYRNGRLIQQYRLPVPAIGISRYALDSRMAQLLRDRGGILKEDVRQRDVSGVGIINACGRSAKAGGYIGMKGHWSDLEINADLELHLGSRCYVGLSKVEGGWINICGLFHSLAPGQFASPSERFHATLELNGLEHLASRLVDSTCRKNSLCSIGGLDYDRTPDTGSALGDSHRQIPPFTGNGMSIALESAAALLPVVVAFSDGRLNWDGFLAKSQAILRNRLKRRYFFANLLHPFLLKPRFQSFLCLLSKSRLIPFAQCYQLTHT